jgi:hypothetical protein
VAADDGAVDLDASPPGACAPGATRSCTSDGQKGTCATGVETCNAGKWSACSIEPATHDTCDPVNDDTCNGVANEGCACVNGDTGSCGAKLGALGACALGVSTCAGGNWGPCTIHPAAADTCDAGNDATCDGQVNQGCTCINGTTGTCGDKLGAKGACAAGTTSCVGGSWGGCGVTPATFDQCVIGNDDMCLGVAVSDVVAQRGFVMPNRGSGLPNPAKYADNGDGTVTDMVTGLLWEQVPNPTTTQCPGSGGCKEAEAEAYCLSKAGHWRLPTVLELVSLVDVTTVNPALDHTAFPPPAGSVGILPSATWTSTTALNGDANYIVTLYSGATGYQLVSLTSAKVLCVSSTPAPGFVSKCYPQRYEAQSDGVLDVATGLVWQQQVDSGSYTFSAAPAYCAARGSGWRVPSIKELLTTVDFSANWPSVPAIDSTVFPGVMLPTPFGPWSQQFFASTKAAPAFADPWVVDYGSGTAKAYTAPNSPLQVRCVR